LAVRFGHRGQARFGIPVTRRTLQASIRFIDKPKSSTT
jgi:hypothetical protein